MREDPEEVSTDEEEEEKEEEKCMSWGRVRCAVLEAGSEGSS